MLLDAIGILYTYLLLELQNIDSQQFPRYNQMATFPLIAFYIFFKIQILQPVLIFFYGCYLCGLAAENPRTWRILDCSL